MNILINFSAAVRLTLFNFFVMRAPPHPSPSKGEGEGGGDIILFNAFVLVGYGRGVTQE